MGNLTHDDVEVITMDWPSAVIALRTGAIDAADITDPYTSQVLNDHVAVMLIPTKVYSPDYSTPLYYGPAILDKDPELGRRFMVAYLQGVNQYNEGKTDRNLAILSNYTQLDRELLNKTCWLPIDPTGNLPKKPVSEYMDWMYTNKMIPQKLNEDQLFDMSYATYANGVLQNTTNNR
jgi:ABC-type nitrate/sulfonate/bicarbonate transport system substrate-binding protein